MNQNEKKFVATVMDYYRQYGRHQLSWRQTTDPYHILVSEIMLQQTQVERVMPKYHAFIAEFPTVQALAKASLGTVLVAWQGLGYNRRAKLLHQCAQVIVREHHGVWPQEYQGLLALPGIGPYTAGAILAFAYNIPVPLIETNVRSVYLYHFFPNETGVPDSALVPIIARTLDQTNPRAWYAALMDYGSYLKRTVGNASKGSKHHTKQTTFAGSDRQIRGSLVRLFTQSTTTHSLIQIQAALPKFDQARVALQLEKLVTEELVQKKRGCYMLPT